MTHRQAFKKFSSQESAAVLWILLSVLVGLKVSHAFDAGISWMDGVAAVCTVFGHHLVEWVAHKYILHGKRGFLFRYHRAHHVRPEDPRFIFMPTLHAVGLLLVVLVVVSIALGAGLAMTIGITMVVMGLLYEWVHYLSHQPVKPKTRLGRKLKRHHMLHHYKNEKYWYGVTGRYVDTVLRTNPDSDQVGHYRGK